MELGPGRKRANVTGARRGIGGDHVRQAPRGGATSVRNGIRGSVPGHHHWTNIGIAALPCGNGVPFRATLAITPKRRRAPRSSKLDVVRARLHGGSTVVPTRTAVHMDRCSTGATSAGSAGNGFFDECVAVEHRHMEGRGRCVA